MARYYKSNTAYSAKFNKGCYAFSISVRFRPKADTFYLFYI